MERQFKFSIQFDREDIVSAHRLRYLHSGRLRLLAGIGLLGLLYLAAKLLVPELLPGGGDLTLPAGVAIIGLGTPLFAYIFAPEYDSRMNSIWKKQFTVLVDSERVTVRQAGQPAGYAMTWKSLSRVLENSRVLVLIFGRENNFLILPKTALGGAQRLADFKKLLSRSLGAKKIKKPAE